MFQHVANVLYNKQVGPAYYRIGLTCPEHYAMARAGQFVMLHTGRDSQPLLRRPFSIHNMIMSDGVVQGLELLYKVVGQGTGLLARRNPGDPVDILGPLGSGFIIPRQARRIYFVSGGIGVAPLVFLAAQLVGRNTDLSECHAFIGGRSKEDLLCQEDFGQHGVSVRATTDDGSAGDQCLVTHPVEELIETARPDILVACGPMEMLACTVGIAEKYGVPCQVSIETMMACGMGACLGCAVEGRQQADRFLHACLDGPVFDAADLKI